MNNLDIKTLWPDLLKKIETAIGPEAVDLWLKPVKPLLLENNILKLEVPDSVVFETLRNRYEAKVLGLLKEITGNTLTIEYSVPLSGTTPAGSFAPIVRTGAPITVKKDSSGHGRLNSNYTFDSFVVGPSNRWAHATAEAVAKKPGYQYNPFFLYSPPGLGKTHLLHAIGNSIFEHNNNAKVLYCACEEFVNEYIGSLQNKTPESFRNKYRRLDCLLLDDVQFLIGKGRSEEEFFYTFNSLFESKKQIVISSDRPPRELSLADQRLISRFLSGMVADVKVPDLETRIAILRKKREIYKFSIPDDVLSYIAESVRRSIRELEGALISVDGYCMSHGLQATRDTVKEALKDVISQLEPEFRVSIDTIKKIVGEKYSLDLHDFKSQKRTEAISFPRQLAMYLSCELTDLSLPGVGEAFNKDHTTVMYARDKMKQKLHSDIYFVEVVNQLIAKIKAVDNR